MSRYEKDPRPKLHPIGSEGSGSRMCYPALTGAFQNKMGLSTLSLWHREWFSIGEEGSTRVDERKWTP